MAAIQHGQRSRSRESGPMNRMNSMNNGNTSLRSQNVDDRGSDLSNGTVLRTEVENRAPAPELGLPKGVGCMLKTDTETGGIGIFSIKPPRSRPNPASPRHIASSAWSDHMSHISRDYRGDGVDDRKRLPSYRDASSEVISMYETASQKSPRRRHDGLDYQNYSMNQQFQYGLSNHRSYSSLRSQPEGSVQRPISPFAYPARLRRPGFRPSSPALTDGGGVDYSRRAEIERVHHVS
jgi:hypothetical protein